MDHRNCMDAMTMSPAELNKNAIKNLTSQVSSQTNIDIATAQIINGIIHRLKSIIIPLHMNWADRTRHQDLLLVRTHPMLAKLTQTVITTRVSTKRVLNLMRIHE